MVASLLFGVTTKAYAKWHKEQTEMNILLGLTGSVASTLAEKLVVELRKPFNYQIGFGNHQIRIIPTECALHFFRPRRLKKFPQVEVLRDKDEWRWRKKGDSVLHIDLTEWADVFVIAPLSANTMAKLRHGICDNLLTSIVRAWKFEPHHNYIPFKPIVVAPAMNTAMWEHPISTEQRDYLEQELGFTFVNPQIKMLACGVEGVGAMADIFQIRDAMFNAIRLAKGNKYEKPTQSSNDQRRR